MPRFRVRVALFLLASLLLTSTAAAGPAERLRRRLEAPRQADALVVGDRHLLCVESLRRFYDARDYALAWSADGRLTAAADSLLAALQAADREGLDPRDYHLPLAKALRARLAASRQAGLKNGREAALVDLDLLLSDAFLLYGAHCLAGHLDPESIDPEWTANRRGGDLAAVLREALAADRVAAALRDLLPPQPGYARLREALARLRRAEDDGGWPSVPAGPRLQFGDAGPRVAALAARLRAAGDLPTDPERFDADLAAAVARFQRRHGLEADGVVGSATLAALNVPVADRIAQLKVNLERWRWLPQDLGGRHVLVNIADQRLQVIREGQPVLEMAVVVGRTYRRTPVFSGLISYLVFSPYWEVPPTLAVQDKLPDLRSDPARLTALGFQVLQGWGESEREIDPLTIDWNRVKPEAFPYRLRQKPGPQNALGGVKFMFPNKFNVYLHDTPARELFTRTVRTFSSGCIRVERPEALAGELLSDQPAWTATAIAAAMTAGREQTVRLKTPLPVHLEYWTAWVDIDGTLQLRSDIYGRDALVLAALGEEPPTSP